MPLDFSSVVTADRLSVSALRVGSADALRPLPIIGRFDCFSGGWNSLCGCGARFACRGVDDPDGLAEDRSHNTKDSHVYPGPEIDNRVASPIQGYMARLRDRMLENRDGEVASYIPELAKADPEAYGMAVVTLDGTCYTIGEADVPFTIQSMSKPFTYGAALMRHGREKVLRHVGVEPTGEAFNSIILDETNNRPFNPMVNAGAISVASLLTGPGDVDQMRQLFSRLAGRDLAIDQDVYVSEKATGHRNRAIAYLMLNSGMIENDPEEVLDLYFQQCAIEVTCADMARMAAVLGNMGVAPGTEDRIFSADAVQDVLTLMNTCGMYDYAGQWAYEIGRAHV